DRRCEQKGVAGRVLVREAHEEAAPDRDAGPADPGEEGAGLRRPDTDRLAEPEGGETLLGLRRSLRLRRTLELASTLVGAGRTPAQVLGREQDQPVEGEEGRRGLRVGEQRTQLVLEQQADQPGGDRAD